MLATQIRQKDGIFYFVSYPVDALLKQARFISRFYSEGDQIKAQEAPANDEVASFISKIEHSDHAFQRELSKKKVEAIKNFYETASTQPPIPGTILLFTAEHLQFTAMGHYKNVGDLDEPRSKYLIIDGQHRLAALEFYRRQNPRDAASIHVPCIIFDGKSEDFATEMFVIINSTPTRINKSHLIDLYESVSWAEPDKKLAARIVDHLYQESDSPLRYKINRLGGRSKQEKWILQAELFNEVHRWVQMDWKQIKASGTTVKHAQRYYEALRDFLKVAQKAWGDAWGNANYMVTKPVCIKAMIRVWGDLMAHAPAPENRLSTWEKKLSAWGTLEREMHKTGFYETFPAKGQVERVALIHRKLAAAANITVRTKKTKA
jgi:DGQHR domain-containing protein